MSDPHDKRKHRHEHQKHDKYPEKRKHPETTQEHVIDVVSQKIQGEFKPHDNKEFSKKHEYDREQDKKHKNKKGH